MLRRTFIKGVIATIVSATIPGIGEQKQLNLLDIKREEQNPRERLYEYGRSIPMFEDYTAKSISTTVKRYLLPDARRAMGKNVTIEIRAKIPTNYRLNKSLAWYTNDIIRDKQPKIISQPQICKVGGYIYCGRLST